MRVSVQTIRNMLCSSRFTFALIRLSVAQLVFDSGVCCYALGVSVAFPSGVKQSGIRLTNASVAEIMNEWSYTFCYPLCAYVF